MTGVDGKTYSPPVAPPERKPRRRPLPDVYQDAFWELQKAVERLERLHRDDRFPANRHGLGMPPGERVAEFGRRLTKLASDLPGGER